MIAFGFCETCKGVTVFPLTPKEAGDLSSTLRQYNELKNDVFCGTSFLREQPRLETALAKTCKKCSAPTANIRHQPIWYVKNAFTLREALNEEHRKTLEMLRHGAYEVHAEVQRKPRGLFPVVARYICEPVDTLTRLSELLGALEDIGLMAPPPETPYYVKHGIRGFTLENE